MCAVERPEMSEQISENGPESGDKAVDRLSERQLKRAIRLRAEADNCIALVLKSETQFAADLIDEAVMLAKRARELSRE
jgi:hypothetical protein